MYVGLAAQVLGPLSGGTFANFPLLGLDKQWRNVANVASSNDVYADFQNLGNAIGTHTDYLKVTNFGFSVPVPVIAGILVEVELSDPNQNTSEYSIRLVKGGVVVGTEKSTGAAYPAADTYRSYGGSNDLWGVAIWTKADIEASDFGVVIAAQRNSSGNTGGQIDHVRITVFYDVVLPLKLLNFSLQKNSNSIGLSWATAEESNMDHFEIQRSANGRDFLSLGSVPNRNQFTQNNYSFEDNQPLKNVSYYRLKMVGATGDISYSRIIPVKFNSAGSAVSLYPIPWHKGTPLNIVNPNNQKLMVQFYNVSGQMIGSITTTSEVVPTKSLTTFKGWGSYKIYDESHSLLGTGKLFVVD